MEKDARLYDIVSSLAINEPVKASDLFKNLLDERIVNNIRDLTKNTTITPAIGNTD